MASEAVVLDLGLCRNHRRSVCARDLGGLTNPFNVLRRPTCTVDFLLVGTKMDPTGP